MQDMIMLQTCQETVVHIGNESSDRASGEDGNAGAGEHGALSCSMSGTTPLNTETDEVHGV
jgi:hypothetical protein